ncbi:hypothetical protein ABGB12_18035 [Actinocorallia sp. B10E7]|uniref:hypothetical protein n=1 Tax=Actinocorallia sp. B10E7 TaxID=3153558 RepID=UPI00325E2510
MSAEAVPRKPDTRRHKRPQGRGAGKLAQVRLRPDEMDALRETMRTLNLESTSDALREGLRLLTREAAELAAAEEIRSFYEGAQAPLPEGVAPPGDAEFEAVDEMEW